MLNKEQQLRVFLVDETPFIEILGRGDNKNIVSLRHFLQDSIKKRNKTRRFRLKMPAICQKRLGWYYFYSLWSFARSRSVFLCSDSDFRDALFKRLLRLKHAKRIIEKPFVRRKLSSFFFRSNQVMELFLHANGAKSKYLKAKGERLESNQVISIEICIIAQIAHSHDLELLSFNSDFSFFSNFDGKPNFVKFHHFDDFLERDYSHNVIRR